MKQYRYDTREAWIADRINFVGASEVASAIGADGAYSSRWELWARKSGKLPGVKETESMRWGQRLEQAIAHAVADEHGGAVEYSPELVCYGPDDRPHHRATPDAVWHRDSGPALLEIKNVDRMLAEHWEGGPPPHVEVQLHWQMYCCGYDRAVAAALIGGNRMVIHEVERDAEVASALRDAVDVFWSTVQSGIEPTAEHRDVTLLPLRWQEKRGDERELLLSDCRSLVDAANAAADATKHYNSQRARVMQAMGEATEGVIDGQAVVTWRENKAGSRVFRLSRNAEGVVYPERESVKA